MFTLIKLKIQNLGRFLSNMIMPNISIFIAWGIMTALFVPLGWYPNPILEQLIKPIIFYLLPILIGYTGGSLISGNRGGLVGSITTIGVIASSTDTPMLLGAMIAGPLGGGTIKYLDKKIEDKIKNGFEMLVNNFSAAICGILLALLSFYTIGPCIEWISHSLEQLIKLILNYNLLPLIAIIIEPAKILFLNNAINHGIFSPLGIQDTLEHHNSVFFLIESNPGPGLGILIAWFLFGKGELSKSSGGAAIIEFLGGVHEIYFPYVLIKPKLIFALILGGMSGIFILILLHGGLISTASPGSILSILAMTPKGFYLANISAIFCSFCISFITASLLLKYNFCIFRQYYPDITKKNQDLNKIKSSKDSHYNVTVNSFENIKNIIVACDAGMGSSAMGASILRKKIKNANLKHISVSNMAINVLSKNADLVITHQNLTDRAKKYAPYAHHISLKNFLNNNFYDSLVEQLTKNIVHKDNTLEKDIHLLNTDNADYKEKSHRLFQLTKKNILLNQYASNKEEAIKIIGRNLVKYGYVKSDYIDSMLAREKIAPTWLGESIALPHGTIEGKNSVLKTGIIFCQFPKGVHFGEEADDIAYLVIGIAAKNNEHIMVVSNITNALDNQDIIKRLSTTSSVEEVLSILSVEKN